MLLKDQVPWSSAEKLCFSLLTQEVPKPSPLSLLAVQAFLLRRSLLFSNLHLLTLLISSLSFKPHLLPHSLRLFACRTAQDSFLCTSVIRSLVGHRRFQESIALYRDLLRRNFDFFPDSFTFPPLFKSCSAAFRRVGLQLHAHLVKMGFCDDPYCSSSLADMYSKFGDMGAATKVFDEITQRSPASWTSMIVGYAKVGNLEAAVEYFKRMPEKDTVAVNAMIDGFVKFGDMNSARKLFDEMQGKSVVSWTSVISGYSKVGDMEAARVLFEEMPFRNLFAWNALIGGYCKNNQPHCALELFRELQSDSCPFRPDEVTIVSIMPAISSTGMIDLGRWVHRYARKNGLDRSSNVSTALMDMYLKCGNVQEAIRILNYIRDKELATWNSMINGLALNGKEIEALDVLSEMVKSGVRPNEVTMIGVLSACAHRGLIEEGSRWFHRMEDLRIEQRIDHYGCMVDLLGRGGLLEEAERLIKEMPFSANGIILSSLLFACVCYKDVDRAERIMEMIETIEPRNVRNYVMLRNLYAEERRWADVERVKDLIRSCGGKKETGCSVIEVGRRCWEFVAGDRVHPEWDRICRILGELELHMKGIGIKREWEFGMLVDSGG